MNETMIAIKNETVPSLLKRITEGNVSYPASFMFRSIGPEWSSMATAVITRRVKRGLEHEMECRQPNTRRNGNDAFGLPSTTRSAKTDVLLLPSETSRT